MESKAPINSIIAEPIDHRITLAEIRGRRVAAAVKQAIENLCDEGVFDLATLRIHVRPVFPLEAALWPEAGHVVIATADPATPWGRQSGKAS